MIFIIFIKTWAWFFSRAVVLNIFGLRSATGLPVSASGTNKSQLTIFQIFWPRSGDFKGGIPVTYVTRFCLFVRQLIEIDIFDIFSILNLSKTLHASPRSIPIKISSSTGSKTFSSCSWKEYKRIPLLQTHADARHWACIHELIYKAFSSRCLWESR